MVAVTLSAVTITADLCTIVEQTIYHLRTLCRSLDTILADKLAANEVALTKEEM